MASPQPPFPHYHSTFPCSPPQHCRQHHHFSHFHLPPFAACPQRHCHCFCHRHHHHSLLKRQTQPHCLLPSHPRFPNFSCPNRNCPSLRPSFSTPPPISTLNQVGNNSRVLDGEETSGFTDRLQEDFVQELEGEEVEEDIFVLTDEWMEFFAKSEAKRRLDKKQKQKKGNK